jgi:tetratricopeptide (TPR) repeat protein
MKYAEKALEEAKRIQDVDLAANLAVDIILPYTFAGEFFKIPEFAPGVIALIEKTQRESEAFGKGYNLYSVILGYYGMATGLLGDFEEGEALCEKALRFALETGDLVSVAMIHHAYGWMLNFKGDGKNVVEHLQESIRYCEEIQLIVVLGHLNSGLGWGYYMLGDMETAREHAERAIRIQGDTGIPFLLSCAYHTLSVVHLDSGNLEEARRCADEALKLSQNNNEKWAEGVSRILLGRVLGKAEKSQFTEAEECILQGIKIQDELRLEPWSYTGYLYLGELYAATGKKEKALETLKKAKVAFQEMGMDYWLRRTQEVLERVKA